MDYPIPTSVSLYSLAGQLVAQHWSYSRLMYLTYAVYLRHVRRQVPTSVIQSLIVALVLSRLDYCSSFLFGLPANLIQRFQSVQNAVARLIFRIRRSEHITFTGCASQNVSTSTEPLRSTLVFHPYVLDDIQTTTAVFYLTSSGRLSVYSRQAGVSGFWCHRFKRPASPRRISAVTRGCQTTQDLSVFPF